MGLLHLAINVRNHLATLSLCSCLVSFTSGAELQSCPGMESSAQEDPGWGAELIDSWEAQQRSSVAFEELTFRKEEIRATLAALVWEPREQDFSPALLLLTGCATLCKPFTLSVLHQLIKESGQAKLIPSAWNASPSIFPQLFLSVLSSHVSSSTRSPEYPLPTTPITPEHIFSALFSSWDLSLSKLSLHLYSFVYLYIISVSSHYRLHKTKDFICLIHHCNTNSQNSTCSVHGTCSWHMAGNQKIVFLLMDHQVIAKTPPRWALGGP